MVTSLARGGHGSAAMTRWTYVCPLLGAALFSCAVEENDFPAPSPLSATDDGGANGASAGTNVGGAHAGVSGSMTANEGGHGGTFSNGGTLANGGSPANGGTFGVSGTSSFGGTFASGGTLGQAGSSAGAGGGGAGGAGGSGSAGKANGGAAGTGGSGSSAACNGVKVPAKSSWKATALRAAAGDPPERAIDGDNATRFSTGAAQAGDEWLQIDFGASVTLNEVRMLTANDDYFRHYQLRLSDKSQDFGAAILKEGDGMTGTVMVSLPQTHKGRYLSIRQTGKVMPAWWSLFEVDVDCN